MRVYYLPSGKIIAAVYDRDYFTWDNTTNSAAVLNIDEIEPDNKGICLDISRKLHKVDENGNGKYYIQDGQLYEREGWQEYVEDVM